MSDIFIDLSMTTNGSGSSANPYNSFTEVNALSGDLSGDTIAIKANGAVIRQILNMADCNNFTITSYGTGARPIIKGTALYTSAWTDNGDGTWYSDTGTGLEDAIFANGVKLEQVGLQGSLSLNQSWYDSGNDRTYIILDGTDPNSVVIEITDIDHCLTLCAAGNGDNIRANDLHMIGSRETTLRALQLVSNVHIHNMLVEYGASEADDTYGKNSCLIRGASAVAPAQASCSIFDNEIRWGRNNAFEFHYFDGVKCYGNTFSTQVGNGVELWQGVINSEFYRNKLLNDNLNDSSSYVGVGASRMFWLTGSNLSTGGNSGNKIYNNIGGKTRTACLKIDSSNDNNVVANNTFYDWSNNGGIEADDTDSDPPLNTTVEGNILYADSHLTFIEMAGAGITGTVDNNLHYAASAGTKTWALGSDSVNDIASWNALASVGTDVEDDPAFTDYPTDLSIPDTSPSPVGVGQVIDDFLKYPRYSDFAGAYEPRLMDEDNTNVLIEL